MRRRKLKFAWFLIVSVLLGFSFSCRRQRFTEGVLTNVSTSIDADWVNIPIPDPSFVKWDSLIVFVEVNSSFQVGNDSLGIRLDDGSIGAPEAELITKAGQRKPLRLAGLDSGEGVQFSGDQIARGSTFSNLRVRSPKTLNCSRITWISYMPQDCKPQGCRFLRLTFRQKAL
jgi:hypothetical protein